MCASGRVDYNCHAPVSDCLHLKMRRPLPSIPPLSAFLHVSLQLLLMLHIIFNANHMPHYAAALPRCRCGRAQLQMFLLSVCSFYKNLLFLLLLLLLL